MTRSVEGSSYVGRVVSAGVLAGCYPKSHNWSTDKCHYHAVQLDADGMPASVLCGKVKLESINDDATQFNKHDITCAPCLKKAEKLARDAAPRAYGRGK